jgi:type IV secretory pathway component VirB8
MLEVGTTVKPGGLGIGHFSALQIGDTMKIKTVSYDESLSKSTKVSVEITATSLKNKNLTEINFPTKEEIIEKNTKDYYRYQVRT